MHGRVRGKEREAAPVEWGEDADFSVGSAFKDLDVPVLKALAVDETVEVEVLLREDQVLRIAEEYANAGIREIKEELADQPVRALWNLLNNIRRL